MSWRQIEASGARIVLPGNPAGRDGPHNDLADCFRVFDPATIGQATNSARTWAGDAYTDHPFKMLAVSSKGAGGTGKTTTTLSLAWGLAMKGKRVVVINADAQPSLEERCLDKLVGTWFDDNYDTFYAANNLTGDTLLRALQRLQGAAPVVEGQGNLPRLLPKVIGVNVEKLATPRHSGSGGEGRLFVMRGDEDISNWEVELGSAWRTFTGQRLADYARPYGAMYHLAQMTAFMLDAEYVVVDTQPGSGPLFMNIVMSSHGFVLPCGIDQKGASMLRSMATKVVSWTDPDNEESHVAIRSLVNKPWLRNGVEYRNNLPLPTHTPKFLGAVFGRLDLQGAKRPYNQYAALTRAGQELRNMLPVLQARRMLLPFDRYINVTSLIPDMLYRHTAGAAANDAGNLVPINAPSLPLGVSAVLLDYGQLAHISERECVPVPHLAVDDTVLRRPHAGNLKVYMEAVMRGLPPAYHPYSPDLYQAMDRPQQARLSALIEITRAMMCHVVTLAESDLTAAAPIHGDIPAVPQPAYLQALNAPPAPPVRRQGKGAAAAAQGRRTDTAEEVNINLNVQVKKRNKRNQED